MYLGFLAIRFSRRLRLPVVTTFLLLGIIVGPEGLNLVNTSVIESLRIVEPIALGMITFAAGEQLRFADIRIFSGRTYLAVGLETVLPVALVVVAAWLLTGRLEIALPMGAIAGTTGLATVMSTLKESGARGSFAKLLGFATASDNVFAILAFTLLLPLAVGLETGGGMGTLYAERLMGMAASVAIGFGFGFVVSRLIKRVSSSSELSMFMLAHVLLMVGITQYLGFSVLLAGLTMGTTAVNLTREVRNRDRAFAALAALEFPVIAMFFLWAGSSLHIRALAGVGLLFVLYLVARAVGKLAGPLAVAWGKRNDESESRRFVGLGVSLLPQAGAAVGLAILARDSLPVSGQTILTTVLGAVVVFELVGPLGVHWSAKYVGEARDVPDGHPLTLDEAIQRLEDRKARVVVAAGSSTSSRTLEVPRTLASRLEADLVVIRVAKSKGVDGALPLLDEQHVGQFLDLVKSHRPDILFVSLPGEMRRLLGPRDALSERVECPVFEIEESRARRWPPISSSTLAGIDRVAEELSLYRAKVQGARILQRITGSNRDQ
jgi:Kef-type K+ transport system membrane component KefB